MRTVGPSLLILDNSLHLKEHTTQNDVSNVNYNDSNILSFHTNMELKLIANGLFRFRVLVELLLVEVSPLWSPGCVKDMMGKKEWGPFEGGPEAVPLSSWILKKSNSNLTAPLYINQCTTYFAQRVCTIFGGKRCHYQGTRLAVYTSLGFGTSMSCSVSDMLPGAENMRRLHMVHSSENRESHINPTSSS